MADAHAAVGLAAQLAGARAGARQRGPAAQPGQDCGQDCKHYLSFIGSLSNSILEVQSLPNDQL